MLTVRNTLFFSQRYWHVCADFPSLGRESYDAERYEVDERWRCDECREMHE